MFVNLFDNRISNLGHAFHTAFECLQCVFKQLVSQFVGLQALEFFLIERTFHSECFEQFQFETFIVQTVGMLFGNSHRSIVNRVQYVQTDTFSHQGVTATGIDHVTL